MMVEAARLAAYTSRLGLAGTITPDATGLARVQAAHRQSITFENLDVMLGRAIAIDSDAVFDKLVGAGRGGYCFEHNRLLADMLAAMGLPSRHLLARTMLGDPPQPMPRTHCLLLLRIGEQEWIADAGFGGAFCPPLPLIEGRETAGGDGAQHRLRRIGAAGSLPGEWLLERRGPAAATDGRTGTADKAGWVAQFAFDLAEVAPADLAMGNYWSFTHKEARFVNAHVVSLCLADGFAGMVERQFSLYRAGAVTEKREIATRTEYGAVLASQLKLALPPADLARLRLFEAA